MNYLVAFILHLAIGSNKPDKYFIILDKGFVLTPTPTRIESFWARNADHDSITIHDPEIIRKIEHGIDRFKLMKRRSIIYQTFSVSRAVIRVSNNTAVDTLYSDQFFGFWKIGDKIYYDKKETIRKTTTGLFPKRYP